WLDMFYPVLLIDGIIMFVTCILGIAKTMDIITIILFICIVIFSLGVTLLQLLEYIRSTTDWSRMWSILGLIFILWTLSTGYYIYFKNSHSEVIEQKQETQEVQMFKLEKPNKKSINSFQQEFLQNMMNVEMKNTKSNTNQILLIPVNDKGYITLKVQTEKLRELEKDNYYKENKDNFEQSLKNNPIKSKTLIKTLQNDLNNDFKFILAGGITPENVLLKIKEANPWGVDVSSGVEHINKDGVTMKSFDKMKVLINKIR
ncbi:MAG: hypothetical protein E7B88_05840, partial [Finegoldia magna]|nr:hypothetical protein [Finegoldia magna]